MKSSRWIKGRNVKCKINCSICSSCWPVSTCITLTENSCLLPIKQCGSQEGVESIEQNLGHVLENVVGECEGHGVDNRSLVYPQGLSYWVLVSIKKAQVIFQISNQTTFLGEIFF